MDKGAWEHVSQEAKVGGGGGVLVVAEVCLSIYYLNIYLSTCLPV